MLSKLILKLMAKNPEKRYYKALGLRQDLEKCQQQWQNQNKITTISLGLGDIGDDLTIPNRLYGREEEVIVIKNIVTVTPP